LILEDVLVVRVIYIKKESLLGKLGIAAGLLGIPLFKSVFGLPFLIERR
jgi:hypothetical protein